MRSLPVIRARRSLRYSALRALLILLTAGLIGCALGEALASVAALGASSDEIVIVARATKVAQLVGEIDHETGRPTVNRTWTRYGLSGTDLGVSFRHNGRIYVLFGDTIGRGVLDGDAIALTADTTPDDGLELSFLLNPNGDYRTLQIPGVSLGAFEVPMEGTSANGRMIIYCTTDHSERAVMGRSIVAASDDGGRSFTYLYDLSTRHFINISTVEVDAEDWPGLPDDERAGLVFFGSGRYRKSDVCLAYQPAEEIESKEALRYFVGLNDDGEPTWSREEEDARALFRQSCVGELSVTYNRFIERWIMLYNCCCDEQTRGINMRTAVRPWGPWSEPQVLFHPWHDDGYCRFMHTDWNYRRCDNVHDEGREYEWGGEYGPYQFEHLATGDKTTTTIYFSMSTWNPYTVVLMKATLRRESPG